MSEKKTNSLEATKRLIIIAPLQRLAVGSEVQKLPPHVTIVPWFDLPTIAWHEFLSDLEDMMTEERFGPVYGGEEDLFGDEHNIKVRKLAGVLFGVHAHTLGIVCSYGCEVDEKYTGINWVPHVSDTPDFALQAEEAVELSELAVVSKQPTAKHVEAVHRWHG